MKKCKKVYLLLKIDVLTKCQKTFSFFNSKYGDSFWCKKIFQNENFQKIRDKVL